MVISSHSDFIKSMLYLNSLFIYQCKTYRGIIPLRGKKAEGLKLEDKTLKVRMGGRIFCGTALQGFVFL